MPTPYVTVILDGSLRAYATAVRAAWLEKVNVRLLVPNPGQRLLPWHRSALWFAQRVRGSHQEAVPHARRTTLAENETPFADPVYSVDEAVEICQQRIPNLDPEEYDISEEWDREECALWGDDAFHFWQKIVCHCGECEECTDDDEFTLVDETHMLDGAQVRCAEQWFQQNKSILGIF